MWITTELMFRPVLNDVGGNLSPGEPGATTIVVRLEKFLGSNLTWAYFMVYLERGSYILPGPGPQGARTRQSTTRRQRHHQAGRPRSDLRGPLHEGDRCSATVAFMNEITLNISSLYGLVAVLLIPPREESNIPRLVPSPFIRAVDLARSGRGTNRRAVKSVPSYELFPPLKPLFCVRFSVFAQRIVP